MAKKKTRITGDAKVKARLRHITKTAPEAALIGIFAFGEAILADATERCPVDTGRLRTSGYCAPPRRAGRNRIEVGFGTDYAVPVHERTDVSHDKGEPKFLTKAVANQLPQALEIIARNAEKHIERGGQPSGPYPEEAQD